MKPELKFLLRPSYGKNRFYPVNEAARILVEVVCARRCFELLEVSALQAAGFPVEVDTSLRPGADGKVGSKW